VLYTFQPPSLPIIHAAHARLSPSRSCTTVTTGTPDSRSLAATARSGSQNKPAAPERFLNQPEYETALAWLDEFGIEDGFYQELETSGDWLSDFSRPNPFPGGLAVPVWHWNHGFL
jgi:hypothetical protein